jgi:hypothetical protein
MGVWGWELNVGKMGTKNSESSERKMEMNYPNK